MRFSFFAVLSGLAALAVVKAFPAENLQPDVLSEEVSESNEELCLTCKSPSCQHVTDVHHHGRPIPVEE